MNTRYDLGVPENILQYWKFLRIAIPFDKMQELLTKVLLQVELDVES